MAKRVGVLVVATLPVAVLIGIVALKLLFMMLFAQLSASAAQAGDYRTALSMARWNLVANYVEPWRAQYNVGTAELGLELFDDSRNSLSLALASAPLPESCQVRTNLALAIEGQGDLAQENDDFANAVLLYAQATAMIDAMPDECASESASDSSDSDDSSDSSDSSEGESGDDGDDAEGDSGGADGTLGDQNEESRERLGDKSEQSQSDLEKQQQEQAENGEGEPEDGGTQSNPFDDLGDRMEEAEQDRADTDSLDRSQNSPFVISDKPW